MSASREKNKRKEQAAVPETANNAKKGMSKGLQTTLIAVCTVLVVCIVVFFYMLTSGFFASHTTAATVSGHNLSPAMVNYFYKNAYSTMQEQYGDFMSYILDTNSPLDEQTYDADTGETWADFFTQQGLTTAAEVYAIADEAKANGYTLSEEEQAAIESQLTSLDLYAAYSNMNRNSYIAAVYGTGCSEKSFREYLEVTTLASSYAQSINSGFTYTDAEIAAEYEANPNSYDAVTYRQFLVSDSLFQTSTDSSDESTADSSDESTADSSDTTEELSEEELTALKEEMASTMAADTAHDEQAFINAAYENAQDSAKESYADESYTLKEDQLYSSLSSDVADWLFDASRTEGDTTYIANDSGVYYVLYYISRSTNDYLLPNVRHILISVSDTSDETAMEEARAKADEILAEFNAGDKTAESFGELAKENTGDSNGDKGGLYENIMPGQMVTEFNDWCFDASRQSGDTGIVYGESSNYKGYHVIYFVGDDVPYWQVQAENALRNTDTETWLDGLLDSAEVVQENGMKHVG